MAERRICILTQPLPDIKGIHIHVSNFVKMIEPLSDKITLISGNFPKDISFDNNVTVESLKYNSKNKTILVRIIKYILMQLHMSYKLVKMRRDFDVIIFYLGGMSLLLPMLLVKILKKDVILIITGSGSKTAKNTYGKSLFRIGGSILCYIIGFLERINYNLSDRIVILSKSLIDDLDLSRYHHKIEFNCAIYVDTYNFMMESDIDQRKNKIGYIGRISAEKGIQNFVQSIPLIPEKYNAHFLIGGEGSLMNEIKDRLKNNSKVVFTGWISHSELQDHLKELKILVVPSYTEVFATIALEAMACGTPVLVTPVGSAPDIITDGENGFFMENNSPECIAKNIERILCYPTLTNIVEKARESVDMNFSYRSITDKYKLILESL